MTKKNRQLRSPSYYSPKFSFKFIILLFLCLPLFSFSQKYLPEIILINIENGKLNEVPWKERRILAELINDIAVAKPRAIVITFSCQGYTSVGADQALIKAVKEAGCVYFSLPLWDKLYNYAKGIGHTYVEEQKEAVRVLCSITYEKKLFPALSLLLNKDIMGRPSNSDFSFKAHKRIKFQEYSLDLVDDLKAKGVFKDKICFIGERKTNYLQAEAFYALASAEIVATSQKKYIYHLVFIALFISFCIAVYLVVQKRINKNKFPHKIGQFNLGIATFLPKANYRSIFDFRSFSAAHYWLWMGDLCLKNDKAISFNLKNFFNSFNDGLGPREVLIRLNSKLYQEKNHAFTNLIHLDIRPQERIITFSNAGFESPLLFINSNKEFRGFPEIGPPLGIKKDIDIGEQKITLEKSDIFILFNSGIVRSRDREDHFIGLEQLKYLITQNCQLSPQKLAEKILRIILDFCYGRQKLDMIFLVIKAD
ncbi:MAG: SpoIIE family protein phosphatase [Candidatus Omnitrophica bacterium]|nr:SpoIIE family protein phosphatase [Candidatus Omnitrophota bacterium]MCM8770464.1 SpoIIE family protein phosphatase [Candidatus Omnitrophota bacterium]